MINLENGKITVNGDDWEPIDHWEVWFMTPFGILSNSNHASKACKSNDMDPNMSVIPVPVAVSKSGIVEVVRR